MSLVKSKLINSVSSVLDLYDNFFAAFGVVGDCGDAVNKGSTLAGVYLFNNNNNNNNNNNKSNNMANLKMQ